jgi:hypothetical protein
MALFFGRRAAAFRSIQILTMAIGVGALGVPSGAGAADINVVLDQARLVKLPQGVATLVIGNPAIADASVQAGGTLVITGKGYGVTNIIALDRAGNNLLEKSIEVRGPRANTIVVYRGVDRESYSCTPNCERRVTLGDGTAFFDTTSGQTSARNGLAQGSVAAPAAR